MDLLRTTKVGISVHAAKKCPEAAAQAKELLGRWKRALEPAKAAKEAPTEEKTAVAVGAVGEVKATVVAKTPEWQGTKTIKLRPAQPIPLRDAEGFLKFKDCPHFSPNLTPKEVLQLGSFGGTYFRTIRSKVTGQSYSDAWREFPGDWFDKLDVRKQVASPVYDPSKNTYKKNCGGDLDMWEGSGWITDIDPFGWFQWYCRFYLGRRCADDERQIGRANGVMGPKGRFRSQLVGKIVNAGKPLKIGLQDFNISPVVRQTLQHWGYRLTLPALEAGAAARGK
ncbi:hypothetical protein B484DRAFT_338149 [Ochromonadaceae sp. CCMP2298]|nr:hypothetical protein B484DRAFT_338149 [Ochromonadaceae sp. CCMP2298]